MSENKPRKPDHCPVCDGTDIEGDSPDFNFGFVTQEMHCVECNSEWVDTYKMVNTDVTIAGSAEAGED